MLNVVDASLAVKWLIPEEHGDRAMNLLAKFRNKSLDLTAPDHILIEMGSALWKRSTLKNEISESEAAESLTDFLALGIKLHPTPSLVGPAMRLAAQERHSIYDMVYVTFARQLGCEFITADRTLKNKLGSKFSFIRWVGDL
ncbi:MAG: type II toxin-antitoxin system VapC family toxin [Bryobacteraceae bacterium]